MADERIIQGVSHPITVRNSRDETGAVAGGDVTGTGISITWQDRPLAEGEEPEGALVDDVINAAIGRLEYYQDSRLACEENERSLEHLRAALGWQEARTARRRDQGVEGTTQPHEQENPEP